VEYIKSPTELSEQLLMIVYYCSVVDNDGAAHSADAACAYSMGYLGHLDIVSDYGGRELVQ